jgi:hypothetical protein
MKLGESHAIKRSHEYSLFSSRRPLIKHVIMAYGVDIPTEVGYIYNKKYQIDEEPDNINDIESKNETSGLPNLKTVFWEEPRGKVTMESVEAPRGSIADHFIKKKIKKEPFASKNEKLVHSGDGSVPYISLSWVHTWLLHAARAKRFSEDDRVTTDQRNALDHIAISHRPHGAIEWVEGPSPKQIELLDPSKLVDTADTGTDHPHGTRYKPEMTRYHNVGTSRTTGIEYTTTVIEALGVEHKETTRYVFRSNNFDLISWNQTQHWTPCTSLYCRNYDILAAVFTDLLKYMHDDLGLV